MNYRNKYIKYKKKYIILQQNAGEDTNNKSEYSYLDHPNMIICKKDEELVGYPEDNEDLYINKFLHNDQELTFKTKNNNSSIINIDSK